MSADLAWPKRDGVVATGSNSSEHDYTDQSSQSSHPPSVQHVQEWDPSAFLNPTMFSSDMVSPDTATPPQNAAHFQLEQSVHAPLHTAHVPQLVHQPGHFGQESYQDGYMQEQYAPPYDIYQSSQIGRASYESTHYRPPTQASDLSPSMAQLGLHQQDFLYSNSNPYPSQLQSNLHAQLPTQNHLYDFHQPNASDRASPLPRHSPFTGSPVSNPSFAAQQDHFSSVSGIDRRPSTADSIHSLHGEYPSELGYLPGATNGTNALGMAPSGVVPSALHPFNQRNAVSGTPYPHLGKDVNGGAARTFNPLAAPPPNTGYTSVHQQHIQGYPDAQTYSDQATGFIQPHALADGTAGTDANGAYPSNAGASPEVTQFIRPVLQQYMETRNRIGFGERTVIVMASKVAQKSYGQERRFLCPPPTAIMIGNSWWSETALGRNDRRAPRVTISISGESVPPESGVEWTSTTGKVVEQGEAPPEPSQFGPDDISAFQTGAKATQTYIGRAVGKQLFISDERQKKVEALVKIVAPGTEEEPERVIGIFPSKPIKVISKPSKKRQSAKNMELCINHGSTVSLFHRLRAQTVSTKYLCVSGSGFSFKGSDGALLPGVDNPHRGGGPSFVAKIGTWDPFIIYIVDVNKPQDPNTPLAPPLQPDYPTPPPNAIGVMHHGSNIPIYYNQTVVLQCLTSGVVSPVLIIRKVERDTTVVGGGLQEGAKGVPDHFCAPGEVCGDPVSQLHKIAFEVFDPSKGMPAPGSPGATGAFLSCVADKVNTYRPSEGRTWNNAEHMSSRSQSPAVPDSPGASSNGSLTDYFSSGSPADSGLDGIPPSSDGGRVNSRRGTKRSNTTSGPVLKGTSKARRRVNSVGSNGSGGGGYVSSSTRYGLSDQSMSSGALWSIDIGESAVWTIVGTEQIRYNFYVPPGMPGARASGVPIKPVTPFPNIVKYLPPDRAAENPAKHGGINRMLMNNGMKPDPRNASLVTIYGENFSKTDPPLLFFGAEPSPFVDVRCQEVLACLPPATSPSSNSESAQQLGLDAVPIAPQPIFIARADGVVYPSSVLFYGK
ncbi:hypothetical protein PIIN_03628 [Serendipita indica DSM 11827]|uniref:LAG1-DNAbind-domain-containing protein n=1 Tax=Serendipita indica (strain DSM 11827) TaxID=1109443 RepID=G4TEE6_SERID|nr:hypothetical protein PIIN_03628 [Serendipita indica DSM 11827]